MEQLPAVVDISSWSPTQQLITPNEETLIVSNNEFEQHTIFRILQRRRQYSRHHASQRVEKLAQRLSRQTLKHNDQQGGSSPVENQQSPVTEKSELNSTEERRAKSMDIEIETTSTGTPLALPPLEVTQTTLAEKPTSILSSQLGTLQTTKPEQSTPKALGFDQTPGRHASSVVQQYAYNDAQLANLARDFTRPLEVDEGYASCQDVNLDEGFWEADKHSAYQNMSDETLGELQACRRRNGLLRFRRSGEAVLRCQNFVRSAPRVRKRMVKRKEMRPRSEIVSV